VTKRQPIQPGDEVALRKGVTPMRPIEGRRNNRTAVVQSVMDPKRYGEGALHLADDLHCCRYWNAAELRVVRRAKP
jgi:hypothetical protein